MNMWRFCSVICFSFALAALAMPFPSKAQVICISNVSPPPELPVYEQPPIPAPGYMWTPGYWASGPNGYFWVPGTWVEPPTIDLLWTPGYWGWRDGIYVWNAGYWGPHIGFYGGVNYGFGYGGIGYEGGRWENGVFAYNRAVNNFGGVTITNVYEKTVAVEPGAIRVSFNGGSGGTTARPTPEEQAAAHDQHVAAIPAQLQHERTASANKALLASENHGRPAIAATAKPGEFTGKGVVAARAPMGAKPTSMPPGNKPAAAVEPGTKPTGAATIETKPSGTAVPEKKGAVEQEHATLKEGTPPKTEAKPVVTAPPQQAVKPKPPTAAAAVKPPQPPAKPTAKPACPPGKTMTPAGCK